MLLQEGEAKIAALDLRVKKEQKGRADAAEVSFSTSCLTALTNQSINHVQLPAGGSHGCNSMYNLPALQITVDTTAFSGCSCHQTCLESRDFQ